MSFGEEESPFGNRAGDLIENFEISVSESCMTSAQSILLNCHTLYWLKD
jgi:hypothetical protein